jgi:Zn-dependent protease/CBS domain-containing protein
VRWSFRIATIAGIGIYVHATFVLLLAWFGISPLLEGLGLEFALSQVALIMALFGIIVLHELGHSLSARYFGIQTEDITLLPIGGLARLSRIPDEPYQELVIALAGPGVNVLIAVSMFVGFVLTGIAMPNTFLVIRESLLMQLFLANIVLAVFNMVPAFPMDGGRVLRAFLALWMSYGRATGIAAAIGQFIAVGFGIIALFGGPPLLVLVALFVWLGASQEASMAKMRSKLGGVPVRRAMITNFYSLHPHDPLQRAVDLVLAGFQEDFPIVAEGRLVGLLTRAKLITSLTDKGRAAYVGDAMERDFETADPGEMLDQVFLRLQSGAHRCMPVVRGGQLIGMVTIENVGEYMMLHAAQGGGS